MRHILCPVDFSELSAQALRYAGRLARACGARVTVLYADLFMPPPYFTEAQIERLEQELNAARQQVENRLRDFAAAAWGSEAPEFEVRTVENVPVEGIRHAAAELQTDLIVMGTHGRGGINHWMLGSVAERVLRASNIPVLTVRGDHTLRSILVAVNDSPASRRSLALAGELAGCFGAELTVAHVREPYGENHIYDLCAWVGETGHCHIREINSEGDPAREILRLASASAYDLLVVGAVHRPFFDGTVIGATTARVVRHASCPVLTVVQPAA